jgi:hypothetical protein
MQPLLLVKSGLEVGIAQHRSTILCELDYELRYLLTSLNTVPEHNLSFLRKATFCFVEELCQVLVVFLYSPNKLGMIHLDSCEDIVSNVRQPTRLGDSECS